MSMRTTLAMGRNENSDWHVWDQGDEEDALYLDVVDVKSGVNVEVEKKDGQEVELEGAAVKLRMSRKAFDAIAREYVRRHPKGTP